MDRLIQDLRLAGRLLLKAPGFTLTAIVTLAIGIGAGTAIFAQINAVFWQPLPVPHPDQLRLLAWSSRQPAFVAMPNVAAGPHLAGGGDTYGSFSYAAYTSMRDGARDAIDLACWADLGETRPVVMRDVGFGTVHFVSGNYFDVLGVRPAIGRTFTADDDVPATAAAMISYPFWQRAFGGDPQVTRRSIDLNGRSFAIVGVTPPGFFGVDASTAPDVLVPVNAIQIAAATSSPLQNPKIWAVCRTFGRVRPHVSTERARLAAEKWLRAEVLAHAPTDPYEMPRLWLIDGTFGMSTTRDALSTPLLILFGAVLATVLIACANIAGLLTVRAAARHREIATRLALGATRVRLVQQFLTESLLLSALGGGLGLALSYVLARVSPAFLSRMMPTVFGVDRALAVTATLDVRVLAFAAAATLGCGVLFGTLPALRATRRDLIGAIKAGADVGRGRAITAETVMVAVQAGLSLVLLFAGLLLIQTLNNLRTTPLGYRPDGLLYARVEPRTGGIRAERRADYFEQAVGRIAAVPAITGVSATDDPPLNVSAAIFSVRQIPICTPGYAPTTAVDSGVQISSVGPKFFETIGTPLRAGREFEWRDGVGSAVSVAIVNQSFVRKFTAGRDPLTQRFGFSCPAIPTAISIIGVVADVKDRPRQSARPRVYFPLGDDGNVVTLVIRTAAAPDLLIPTVRRAMTQFNVSVPTFGEITPLALREQQMRQERLMAGVVLLFGGVAIILAAIGIYGMLGYLVLRRTRDIGIRLAIGARPVHVAVDVVRAAMVPFAIGLGLGCLIAIAAARWAESVLFGVSTHDPLAMAIGIVILAAVALTAAAVPARRAAMTDPLRALRFE